MIMKKEVGEGEKRKRKSKKERNSLVSGWIFQVHYME